jgi:hypothetical protein
VIRRAWSIIRNPEAAWAAIAAERAPVSEVLLGYALPMSLLPAIAWVVGSLLFPNDIGGAAGARTPGEIVFSGVWTLAASLLTVALLAAALATVAPMYGAPRRWADAFRVAGYGLTPFWVAGLLLVKPVLVIVMVFAALHCCFVLPPGARALLSVRADEAAEFVAASTFLTILASTALGGVFGSFQWI